MGIRGSARFTAQSASKLGRLDPRTGRLEEIEAELANTRPAEQWRLRRRARLMRELLAPQRRSPTPP
jgi:hypothetical protein